MELINVSISGVPDQDDVLRLLFFYSSFYGREAVGNDFDPKLIAVGQAHLVACGECQEALKDSGMAELASSAARAVIVNELANLARSGLGLQVVETAPEQPTATSTLEELRTQTKGVMDWLEIQLDTGSTLLDHIQHLQRQEAKEGQD